MPHTKHFISKLNQCLDELGVPSNIRERSVIFSKMMHIPKQQAWAILEGQIVPDEALSEKIAAELEVEFDWLFNINEQK